MMVLSFGRHRLMLWHGVLRCWAYQFWVNHIWCKRWPFRLHDLSPQTLSIKLIFPWISELRPPYPAETLWSIQVLTEWQSIEGEIRCIKLEYDKKAYLNICHNFTFCPNQQPVMSPLLKLGSQMESGGEITLMSCDLWCFILQLDLHVSLIFCLCFLYISDCFIFTIKSHWIQKCNILYCFIFLNSQSFVTKMLNTVHSRTIYAAD